jgi:hypothetical protein
MSEPTPEAPEWTAVHGPESAGNPAEVATNVLATGVSASGREVSLPIRLSRFIPRCGQAAAESGSLLGEARPAWPCSVAGEVTAEECHASNDPTVWVQRRISGADRPPNDL